MNIRVDTAGPLRWSGFGGISRHRRFSAGATGHIVKMLTKFYSGRGRFSISMGNGFNPIKARNGAAGDYYNG
ncbi:MAG: hypothetical protein ABI876_02635, partial [Bacteroidota bacterium]